MESGARATAGRRSPTATTVEQSVLAYAHQHPGDGQAKAAQALRGRGLRVSPAGVRYIWRKHGLETTYKRLRAVAGVAGKSELTLAQQAILRRGAATRRLALRSRLTMRGGDPMAADERRSQILLAAAELFDRHGYAGTSIRDIARWVGLLPGSVYHHFPGKEDLFVAVNHEAFQRLGRRIRRVLDEGMTPQRRLEAACVAHVEAVVIGDPIARFGATALFALHEQKLQRRMQADREAYDALFRQLIDDLELPRGTNRTVFRLSLIGALNWTRLWYRHGRLTPRQIATQVVATFCGAAHR
ncbi:MAG: TetR/AcrR family transcriptional regulator [Gammaproteobacteria bacterium]|nr:TetR/AcrR family transcriptional regulator [Gammaproteobacteria bacterium]